MSCRTFLYFASRHCCAVLVVALATGGLAGAAPLTLAEATRVAVEQAPRLEARTAAVDAAQAEASRAGELPDPMLMLGIENLPVTGSEAFDASVDDMTMKRVGLRQEIPAAAKRSASRALAARVVDEARADAVAERLAVQRAAAEAWIDLWAAGHETTALRRLREETALAATLVAARLRAGAASASFALAAQAAVLELDNRLEAARARQLAARAALARWVPDSRADDTAGEPDFSTLSVAREQLVAAVDRLGPVLQARARVETAAAAIDQARAEKRPDWSVAAFYGQRDRDRSDMLSVEVGIGLPVFGSRRQDRGVFAREAQYRQVLAEREDAERQSVAAINAAWSRWQGLLRQVSLHESQLLPLAGHRSAAAQAAYRAGGQLQPWIDARRAELEIHLSHAEHLGELGRAWAALAYLLPSETRS
jgi:outer membrane protein TolC